MFQFKGFEINRNVVVVVFTIITISQLFTFFLTFVGAYQIATFITSRACARIPTFVYICMNKIEIDLILVNNLLLVFKIRRLCYVQ